MVGVSVQKYGMGSNSMTMSALVLFIVTFEYMTQNMLCASYFYCLSVCLSVYLLHYTMDVVWNKINVCMYVCMYMFRNDTGTDRVARSHSWNDVECTSVVECLLASSGHDYIGQKAVTENGRDCQAWSDQLPHQHRYTDDVLFPDGSVANASNYCRNPRTDWIGLWCYTTDRSVTWERCVVPHCGQSVKLFIAH